MRKWNQDCLLQNQKNKLKDESGITLVELLAALSILSVVIILAGSIHMFGQRQFISQTESASQANDLSYAMTVMSTDLRKQKLENVDVRNNIISVKTDKDRKFTEEHQRYFKVGNQLMKNGEVFIESVSKFNTTEVESGLTIKIESNINLASDKDYSTTIYFRGESAN